MGLDRLPQNPSEKPFERRSHEPGDYRIEISPDQVRRSIEKGMPELEIASLELIGGGLGSQAFLINGKYVARFARHEGATKTQQREANILPAIHESISTPIPDILYFGKQNESELSFMIYEILPGRESRKRDFVSEDGELNNAAIEDLANFFKQLHAFPVERAREAGVRTENPYEHFRNALEDAREVLYPYLDNAQSQDAQKLKDAIEKFFADYFAEEQNFEFIPTLIHGDLEAEHVMIDPKTKRISGIIDFGGLRIYDVDYELWRPYNHYGKEVIDKLLEYYPHPNPELLYKKMEFYWKAQTVRRVVRRLKLGDMEGAKRSFAKMREKLYE